MNSPEIRTRPLLGNRKGFTLLEVMIVLAILGIAIPAMLDAFTPAVRSSGSEERTTVFTNQARGTLGRLTSLRFDKLNSNQGNPANLALLLGSQNEANKETFTFGGNSYTPSRPLPTPAGVRATFWRSPYPWKA